MELDPDARDFVGATLAPLSADEGTEALLEEAIAVASLLPAPTRSDTTAVATARMRRTAKSFRSRAGILYFLPLLIALIAGWLALFGPQAIRSLKSMMLTNQSANALGSMCCDNSRVMRLPWFRPGKGLPNDPTIKAISRKIPADRQLLVFGDIRQTDPVQQWKAVWEAHPASPEHYWVYALAYQEAHSKWPEDFVATGERLDPGNGWFRLIEATSLVRSSLADPPSSPTKSAPSPLIKTIRRGSGTKPTPSTPPPPQEKIVTDPIALGIAQTKLEEALAMPRLDDYRPLLDRLRFQAMPPPVDLCDYGCMWVAGYSQPEDQNDDWLSCRSLGHWVSFASRQAVSTGDEPSLRKVTDLFERTLRRLTEVPGSILPRLVVRVFATQGGRALAATWGDAGDPKKAAGFEELVRKLDTKLTPIPRPPSDALDQDFDGPFAKPLYVWRSPDSATVRESDLRGGRLAEYAMYERLFVYAIALLLFLTFAFLIGVSIFDRKRLGPLPARLMDLLTGRDWGWILASGVALPVAVYLISERLLGSRDHSLNQWHFLLWAAQWLGLFFSILLVTLRTARWRLQKRAALLGFGWLRMDFGRICIGLALSMMPAAMLVEKSQAPWGPSASWWEQPTWSIWIVHLFLIFWLTVQLLGCFADPAKRKIQRAALTRAMIPGVACALMLAALAMPRIYQEEIFWTQRLGFEALTPENSIVTSRLDREMADWTGRQILRALDERMAADRAEQ